MESRSTILKICSTARKLDQRSLYLQSDCLLLVDENNRHFDLCFGMHHFVSFLFLQLFFYEEERAGCFAFIVFQMSCYCKCFVALRHGAVGWSAVCDCGIS